MIRQSYQNVNAFKLSIYKNIFHNRSGANTPVTKQRLKRPYFRSDCTGQENDT
jgi:hypothetical protein